MRGLASVVVVAAIAGTAAAERPLVVASKPFAESYLLAEMFAQVLESQGMAVERRLGLGSTEVCFGALRSGAIDVYPEYTGTGLVAVLGDTPTADAREAFRRVAREFSARWAVHWLPPLGFENSYAIAVRRGTAERYRLRTLSDLVSVAPSLTAGFSPDFLGREDGLQGLGAAYGLEFRGARSLLQAVKYRALAAGTVDLIDGYSTDGSILRYDLVVLEDDRGFFPAYEAAPLVSARLWEQRPLAVRALSQLGGRLDVGRMRELNERLEVRGEGVERIAAAALGELGLGRQPGTPAPSGGTNRRGGPLETVWQKRGELVALTARHVVLVGISVAVAVLVAVPLGLLLERRRGSAESVIRAVGVLQTVPSIALLAFMIPLLGIGVVPALVALFLYSLFPILRNTYTGIRTADPAAVDAATSLGMTPLQVLRHVRLPLAAPVIMAGIRTATVINVGTATLAAFIGAGGLGDPIVAGLALADTGMILSGAIPAAALALIADGLLGAVERRVRPAGPERRQ